MNLLFELQNIIFTKLKQNHLSVQVFKVKADLPKAKYILFESAKEDSSFCNKREFCFNLIVFPNSFNYAALDEILQALAGLIAENDFCHLKGFVNYKLKNIRIASNQNEGFTGIVEVAIFFTPF